ncbi:MAG: Gfo/Idh/MocA family oxidoreductase [Gemmatimonadota bacterium]|nr:Gfo/Idh/MocA family oxidoreductase [Gemmatimonadota bacterium]|tara:strand:+ start:6413 stop:7426 length:1014 start_codon:yes stop_codon:yes gene_type:complete
MGGGSSLRVGVIGTGAVSQIVHVPIFSEREDVHLLAVADVETHKAETLSERFGVPLVLSADALITHDELDAVVICTPNHLHEEMAIGALEAGKHVFVERPLAVSANGVRRVLGAAESSGRVLVVGMPHRFRPGVMALRDSVAGNELGSIYAVRGSWMTRAVPGRRLDWRQDPELSGGGALVDLGVPALDLCLWLVGFPDVRRVSCVLGPPGVSIEGAGTLMAETRDGVALTVEVSNRLFASEDQYYARVMGTEGSGALPPLEVFKQLGGRPSEVTPRPPRPRGGENPYTNAYRRLLDDFISRAIGRREVELPREQVQLMALIEAAYQAADSGREVEL